MQAAARMPGAWAPRRRRRRRRRCTRSAARARARSPLCSSSSSSHCSPPMHALTLGRSTAPRLLAVTFVILVVIAICRFALPTEARERRAAATTPPRSSAPRSALCLSSLTSHDTTAASRLPPSPRVLREAMAAYLCVGRPHSPGRARLCALLSV